MKKLISLLAVMAIILSCAVLGIGTVASAAEESSADDFLVFDGVLEEYVGAGGDVVIPASLGIKEIAAQAFYKNLDITSLTIPEGVEEVGYWSVRGCENLEKVVLPYTLEKLAEHCFSRAIITEIVIPGNVEVIGYGAFSGCKYLENATISYGVKEILPLAFETTSIHELVFPESVELICGLSFMNMNYDGKYEYIFANPDVEVGDYAKNSQASQKHNWEAKKTACFHSAKYSVSYELIVPAGSEIEKYFKSDDFKDICERGEHTKNDSYKVKTKEASYFAQYGEGWGMKDPAGNDGGDGGNVSDPGNNNVGNGNGGNGTTNNQNGNTQNNNQNGTNGSVQYVTEESDNDTLIIVICVIGGVMLLAIIAVVILAATGVLFGKKKPAEGAAEGAIDPNDPEALKAALERIENEKAKIDPNDPEALKAALEKLQNKTEE